MPFGLVFNHYQKDPPENYYKYNGKEEQPEIGWIAYEFRFYDPELGRFPSVDPIISDFPSHTPYNYAFSNPVTLVDMWGLQGVHPGVYNYQRSQRAEILSDSKSEYISKLKSVTTQDKVAAGGSAAAVGGALGLPYLITEAAAFLSNPYAYLFLAASNPATVETALETGLDVLSPDGAPINVRGGLDDLVTGSKLNSAVTEWVGLQRSLAKSKRQLNRFNTASVVYDATSDSYFYGMNKGIALSGLDIHPTLLKNLPEESLNNFKLGNCAECDAVNQALHNGASWDDLTLHTVGVGPDGATFLKPQCENCQYTFDGLRSTSEQ